MLKKARNALLTSLIAILVFGLGAAVACDGNYCEPFDDSHCYALDEIIEDTCCVPAGSGRQCATCSREVFMCFDSYGWSDVNGPAFNCHSYGAACK